MAESLPSPKIVCRREPLSKLYDLFEKQVATPLLSNADIPEDRAADAKKRFMEIFRSSFEEHITLEEAANEEDKIDYFDNVVLPKLDEMLSETTKKRKTYPRKCRNLLKDRLRFHRQELRRLQFKAESPDFGPQPSNDDLLKSFAEITATVDDFANNVDGKMEKLQEAAANLETLKRMNRDLSFLRDPEEPSYLELQKDAAREAAVRCPPETLADLDSL